MSRQFCGTFFLVQSQQSLEASLAPNSARFGESCLLEKFTAGLTHAFVECGQKTENYGSDVHSYIFRTAEVTYIAVRICTGMDLFSPM